MLCYTFYLRKVIVPNILQQQLRTEKFMTFYERETFKFTTNIGQ